MVRHSEYEPGTPSWADLASPDPDASRNFYGALFGWTAEQSTEPEAHGYTVFMRGDAAAAGLGPVFGDIPPHWNTYVTVADVDEAVVAAATAGGQVMLEPMDVFDAGRMAIIADPGGAALSLWEPRNHIGAGVTMEPSAICWHELNTRTPDAAKAFYGTLFGWDARQVGGPGFDYTELLLGETGVAGLIAWTRTGPPRCPTTGCCTSPWPTATWRRRG